MSYYTEILEMRMKVRAIIKGMVDGIHKDDIIFDILNQYAIGKKPVLDWINILITSKKIEEKEGLLFWKE